jgi:4a-hydroxytetrahydrobiopterin dehydratase
MEKLNAVQVESHLQDVQGWKRTDDKFIEKKYRFKQFMIGIAFVNEVANLAEHHFNHHPFFSIDYKLVTLRMTTWHAGGLTELDFTCARAFDETYAKVISKSEERS